MAHEKNTIPPEDVDALDAAQVEFSLNPAFLLSPANHFLQAQAHFVNSIGKLPTVWFEHWLDATQSMVDAGRRITSQGANDPASVMKEITDLQSQSIILLTEYRKDCTDMMSGHAGALAANEAEAMEETDRTAKTAAKG